MHNKVSLTIYKNESWMLAAY